jgi:hypothetical protein
MNSRGAKNDVTRRQGIDYPLLTTYLPFTHLLLSRRVVAGYREVTCQTGCEYQGGGRKVTCCAAKYKQ